MKITPSIALFLLFANMSPTGAAVLYWDADGDSGSSIGGNGDWSSSSANWRLDSETGPLTTWTNSSTVVIAGPSAIQLKYWSGAVVQDIIVSGGSSGLYNAGSLQFLTGSSIDVSSGSAFNLSINNLTGSNGYTKTGGGSLNLWSNLTNFTGTVTHDGGTMQLRVGDAIGTSGNLVVKGGSWLQFLNNNATTYGSVSANSVSIDNNTAALNVQTGRLSNGEGVTHTLGSLTLGARRVNVSAHATTSGTSGLIFADTELTGDATINVASNATVSLDALSGAYSLIKEGSGELSLTGAVNTATGDLILRDGTTILDAGGTATFANAVTLGSSGGVAILMLNGQSSIFSDALTIAADATIDFSGSGSSSVFFGDSSNELWAGLLYIINFDSGVDSLRIGITASGLTAAQLSQIVWVGLGEDGSDIIGASINGNGYITAIPESTSLSLLISATVGAIAWLRLKRRR